MTTYSMTSAAARAARQACVAGGISKPMSGVHFRVVPAEGDRYAYELIDVRSGSVTSSETPEDWTADVEAATAPAPLARSVSVDDVFDNPTGWLTGAPAAKPSLVELASTIESGSADDKIAVAKALANANPTRKADLARAKKEADERKAHAAAKAPAAAEAKPVTKRAQAEADAAAGKIPAAPDFSAGTHKPFLKKHAALVALVEAGDVKGLKAFAINPVSSSPKALDRYRTLAVIALEARKAAAKS